ncbi:MAG TPA: nucleotidyltransferase domain-containing protein [Opitutaceae bacterium]|nr:nucleotidyltransferase domain-containing protein [Opitutaceae bacterium]
MIAVASHGLSTATLEKLRTVLERFPEVERAVLFGSRAKGSHKPGSDIDLALEGTALDWRIVGRIYGALDDLMLPYTFSLIVHDQATDPEVAAHIARVGIPIFERQLAR